MKAIGAGTSTFCINEAASAWKLLNGIVCIYKQPGISLKSTSRVIKFKLCEELNAMKPMPRQDIVSIRRIPIDQSLTTINNPDDKVIAQIKDGKGLVEIVKSKSYADHPLVKGRGYHLEDIKLLFASNLGRDSSGLAVLGVNEGCLTSQLITKNKWLSTYIVSGQFGKATDTFFYNGKVLEKSTYHNIRKHMIDRMLASTQASHQRMSFDASGIPLESERAYELASKGLVRPQTSSAPMLYSIKCVKFNPPDFDLEICGVNENEGYLKQFVHELGLRLHSVACCTKIQCTKVGPFNLELTLLNRHWTLQNFMSNINQTTNMLKHFNLYDREPLINKV